VTGRFCGPVVAVEVVVVGLIGALEVVVACWPLDVDVVEEVEVDWLAAGLLEQAASTSEIAPPVIAMTTALRNAMVSLPWVATCIVEVAGVKTEPSQWSR
jgi:hypothetical protein